jgi:biopolymer transport protein ExbD
MSMMVGKKGVKHDINITPYIDILLVLLIIFMVAAPLKKNDHPVRVPQPAPPQKQDQKAKPDLIIVDMDLDHSVRLNSQPTSLDKLESTLTEVFRRRASKSMFIRGDASMPYGDVFVVLDIAKRSGAQDIALLDKNEKNLPPVTPPGGN